ncbi:unnamed protein product, partial [Chrysoparadoxa australica]
RLFSNLEECEVPEEGFKHKPGNLLAATATVTGTTVGAGILALPATTITPGFIPSSAALIVAWIFMSCTGLLVAEVNVNLICRNGQTGQGLLTLAEQSIGKGRARVAAVVYVVIHFALLVAYIAQGGGLLASGVGSLLGLPPGQVLPWEGSVAFTALIGGFMAVKSEEAVTQLNNFLVALVLASFVGLLGFGAQGVHPEYLLHTDVPAVIHAFPVMFVALVFHNVIPVITTQLEADIGKIRAAILGGSALPLVMFLLWNAVILGSVDPELPRASGFDPVAMLEQNAGDVVAPLVTGFSEVAIITSFIGFVIGLLDFFTDAFDIEAGNRAKEAPLFALILLPPLAVACTNPDIFFKALDNAGAFGISLLFGALPALMAWSQRYCDDEVVATFPLVPGGRAGLASILGISGMVVLQKAVEDLSQFFE